MIAIVMAPGIQLYAAIPIAGAEYRIKIDPAVKEPPGHIAYQGLEKRVRRHGVGELRLSGRPSYCDEILVA